MIAKKDFMSAVRVGLYRSSRFFKMDSSKAVSALQSDHSLRSLVKNVSIIGLAGIKFVPNVPREIAYAMQFINKENTVKSAGKPAP
jgi:hypothetical protein